MPTSDTPRPLVCIQGLGFVGTAMAVAVASALDGDAPCFDVVAVELDTPAGRDKVDRVNTGQLPLTTTDEVLSTRFREAIQRGNLRATVDPAAYERAAVAVVDVHLDVSLADHSVDFTAFRAAIRTLGMRLPPGALVVVETTVPPGTCERIVAPELQRALEARGLPGDALLLAHAYERVMPGPRYYDSVVNFWRVYAGSTPDAADACERFLSRVINVEDFPLRRLHSTTASETAKVLENSYRAATIAMIDEWGRFAEAAGVDLFEVIDAIRVRPTHANIREPGLGVGGYCLAKDPALVIAGSRLMGLDGLDFPFARMTLEVNERMPLASVALLRDALGTLSGKRILLLGVTYRGDVGDTRFSPSATLVSAVEADGGSVVAHDPLVSRWPELDRDVAQVLPDPGDVDAVVLAVAHGEYRTLDVAGWMGGSRALILDTNHVLEDAQVSALRASGHTVRFIGRGS